MLFDKKDAAKIELDAVYQLALGGLEVLKKNEPRLKPFEATLFSPSAKEMSRELQTKEANARLDESINTFLSLLAPFFLEKHTHKVLEYLIRRYRFVFLILCQHECLRIRPLSFKTYHLPFLAIE